MELAELPPLPRGLVKVRIEGCFRLETMSFDVSQTNELKVLKVHNCGSVTELPGLGCLTSLTDLKLSNCKYLAELPPLPRGLVKVRIDGCFRLKTMSFDVSQTNELKVLEVSSCESLTKISGLGYLTSLTELKLSNCTELAELPPLPRGLVKVRIEGCFRLKTMSFDVSQTNELKVLKVHNCESVTEVPGLGCLTSLTELKLSNCKYLAELPPLPRGLVKVRIDGCFRLKTMSFDVSQTNELKVLEVSSCESLTKISGLGCLTSLTELKLSNCTELAELPPLPRGLVKVRIGRCFRLKTMSFHVSQTNESKVLEVSSCESLTKISGLGYLTSLTELKLSNCTELAELPPLPRGLVKVRIGGCFRLKTMSFHVSQTNELKGLEVSSCESLTKISGLGCLTSLTELKLSNCKYLAELPPLPRGLVKVRIEGCFRLKTMSFHVSQTNELKVLEVSSCESLTKISGFGCLTSLRELKLSNCTELAELVPLPRGLVKVRIHGCFWWKAMSFDV
eukprot:Gb_02566 [translate_table: standard]